MVVGAASAANTDDIAVSDLNANPNDSYIPVNDNSDYSISIIANDIEEGSNATIQFNVTNMKGLIDNTAYGTFKIDDKESGNVSIRYLSHDSASCTYTFENLTFGEKTVTVKFYSSADDDDPNVVNKTFNVIQLHQDPNLTVSGVVNIYLNEPFTVTVNVTNAAHYAGHVQFWIDGILVRTIPFGFWDWRYTIPSNLTEGSHNITVKYLNDSRVFLPSEVTKDFEVYGSFDIKKADPQFILEVFGEHPNVDPEHNQDFGIYVKDNIVFFGNLPLDATGVVKFSIDQITWYNATVIDGIAKYEFGELPAGEYTLYVYYSGDDKYNSAYSNTTFTVESPSPYVPKHVDSVEPVVPTMANTGNPLFVLLIALSALGIGSLRRKL